MDGWVSFDVQRISEGRAGGVGKIVLSSSFIEERKSLYVDC